MTERGSTNIENEGTSPDILTEQERERLVLTSAERAVDTMHELYEEEFNPRALYPVTVSDDDVDQAAKIHPQLLSPFTIVKRDPKGGLVAVPYHTEFREKLEEIAGYVRDAASATNNPEFEAYLKAVENELLNGEEGRAATVEAWLSMEEEPEIDLVCGFSDRYDDRRKRKFSPQAWTGVINRPLTAELQSFTDRQLEIWHEIAPKNLHVDPVIKVRVQERSRFGGLARSITGENSPRKGWSGNNMPSEQELRERFGSKITLFKDSQVNLLVEKRLPALRKNIHRRIRKNWSQEDLVDAGILVTAAHEPSHSLVRRKNDQERLGKEFAFVNEAYSTVLGFAIVGLRDDVSEDTKNMMIAVEFGTVIADFADFIEAGRNRNFGRMNYLHGEALIINSLIAKELITIDSNGQIRWDNTDDIYGTFTDMAEDFEEVVSRATENDVGKIRRSYCKFDNLETLASFKEAA